MDERLWLILAVSLFFWLLYLPHHRRKIRFNLIRVPRVIAWLAGSRDTYVNWRSLSLQLGFAVFFLSQWILVELGIQNFMLYGGALTLISILLIQGAIKLFYKDNHLE